MPLSYAMCPDCRGEGVNPDSKYLWAGMTDEEIEKEFSCQNPECRGGRVMIEVDEHDNPIL